MKSPRLARLLIRLTAPRAHREDALGDLEETYRGWLSSMLDAVILSAGFLTQRVFHVGMLADVRLGFRILVRQPFTALTTIVALTVGIGLANVGFATMEAMLYSRLPFEHGNRFVRITAPDLPADAYARLASTPALAHLGAMTGGRESAITPSSFRVLPVVPLAGRGLTADDALPGAAKVTVLSEVEWRVSGMPAIGSTRDISGIDHTIVGVLPESFKFPSAPAAWVPLDEGFLTGRAPLDRNARLFGVLQPEATLEQLTTQLQAIASLVPQPAGGPAVTITATAFTDLGPMAPMLASVIVLTVCAVLAVIAANVGNLILARSFARAREFALRAALGASRGRLVTQVMTEVLVLGSIAAVLGTLGAHTILRRFNSMDEIPYWVDFTGGPLTFAAVAATTLMAAAIAGAWPAFKATRRDVLAGLQGGDHRTSDVRFGRVAGAMVVTQIAVSIVMLHGALVVAQAFRNYSAPAIALPSNVLTMNVTVGKGFTVADVERLVAGVPGVLSVGAATSLPRHSPQMQRVNDRSVPAAAVTPSFFDTLAATVESGRAFTATDSLPGAPPVAIVNAPFAREVMGGAAVGQRFRTEESTGYGPWIEVVGVVRDLGLSVGDPAFRAGYYVPLAQDLSQAYLALRVTGDPASYAEPVRRLLRDRAPQVVTSRIERLDEVNGDDRAFFAGLSSALVGLGIVTLVLALAGVYSMMALIVSRRTREIGIRLALGASVSHVVRTIGARAALQLAGGGLLGAGLAVVSLDARSLLVSRLGDGGPWTLPGVLVLLIGAGITATWVPLRRALRIRPQDALRSD